MSQYIITIVPVLDDGAADALPQTMVRVETEGGRLTVKELTMRAPEGAGLMGGELPSVDFDLLLRAFSGRTYGTATNQSNRMPANGQGNAAGRTAIRQDGNARTAAARQSGARQTGTRQSAGRKDKTRMKAGRAYRRAPEAAALEKVYAKTGTIAGVAAHFDVPVHTAQGWISRLRRKAGTAAETA